MSGRPSRDIPSRFRPFPVRSPPAILFQPAQRGHPGNNGGPLFAVNGSEALSPRLPVVIFLTFVLLAGLTSEPASGGSALVPQMPDLIPYQDHMQRHYVSRE